MDSLRHHHQPPSRPLDLEVTIVSAKHLKNVNWRNGDLKPYVVAYLEPDRRAATKSDDSGSTRPVWNERLVLPLLLPPSGALSFLTLDVFHCKPSETPKPLVGTARCPIKELLDPQVFATYVTGCGGGRASTIQSLEIRRPSGRPQGKIRIKLAVRERPVPPPEPPKHHFPPHPPPSPGYYYSNAPPFPTASPPSPHSTRDYQTLSPPPTFPPYGLPPPRPHPYPSQYPYGSYSDPYYAGFYHAASAAYYSAPPAPAPAPSPTQGTSRPYNDRAYNFDSPTIPIGYSSGVSSSEHKPIGGRMGAASGLAVGAVAGAMGTLSLERSLKYRDEKIAERAENDLSTPDNYSDYRADY